MNRLFFPVQRLHPGKAVKSLILYVDTSNTFYMLILPIHTKCQQHGGGGGESKSRIKGERKALDGWGGAGGGRRYFVHIFKSHVGLYAFKRQLRRNVMIVMVLVNILRGGNVRRD